MTMPYAITLLANLLLTIAFNGTFDLYGYWSWDELIGWHGTGVRQTLIDPAGLDGTIIAENRKGGRALVLRGFGGASSADRWWRAANRLEAVTDSIIGNDGTLSVAESRLSTRRITVRLAPPGLGVRRAGPILASINAQGSLQVAVGFLFEIPLLAANPAKS